MKGDFTRFSHDPMKRYTRVLKQQGRVDLDADWNEAAEIFTHLERTEAQDVIGRCGVPEHSNGYKIELSADRTNLTISRGRIYVDGILCSNEAPPDDPEPDQPILITDQKNELPGYTLPATNGVYLAYVDVWERHITYVEDPDLREVALGGPDTTTRTRTQCQVKLELLNEDGPLENLECRQFTGILNTGHLSAQAEEDETATNPCVVPASAGYRGLENRLYRVEIHDDGRDADGSQERTPTFKWSRDNGSVVLPIAADGIAGQEVTLKRFGPDDLLTVKVGDWVEVSGDETELYGRHGTLAQIEPDGIDKANLEITLSRDVSSHQSEAHLKLRRWDHHATDDVTLRDGALPIQEGWFELEDGVQILFDHTATYHVGDYWVIPARTREGTVLWPQEGGGPVERGRLGIQHHYCTLALVRRADGVWTEVRDCRNLFSPLTEVGDGGCCVRVMPGEDIQQAIDTVIGAGGGCVILCQGVHYIKGPLRISNCQKVRILGVGTATVLYLHAEDGEGGIVITNCMRVSVEDMVLVSKASDPRSLIDVRHNKYWGLNRSIELRGLIIGNFGDSSDKPHICSAIRLAHTEGVVIRDCRMVAEAGVVALWGNELPRIAVDAGDLRYGNGVVDLLMENTTIRFRKYGVLSATCERWTLAQSDIQILQEEAWKPVKDNIDEAASLKDYAGLIEDLEALWSSQGAPQEETVALAAFLWRDTTVRDCVLCGYHGIYSYWCVRNTVQSSRIISEDAGLFAFWLHDSALTHSRVTASGGTAVAFAGSYRVRLDSNDLRGLVGVGDLDLAAGLNSHSLLLTALARGYGRKDTYHRFVLFWIMTEESVELMGLGELMEAFEKQYPEILNGVPATVFLAYLVWTVFSRPTGAAEDRLALPVIDLHMSHNHLSGENRGVFLNGFIPLGSLRLVGNRIGSDAGQAVLVEAFGFLANAHLAVFLYRALFVTLLEKTEEADRESNILLKAWRNLLTRWQQESEDFLELDFRIQGNTIRSLRTAIESNIFELAVVNNHITMVERPTGVAEANATISGHVNVTERGSTTAVLRGATVSIVGSSRVVTTDEAGSYSIAGIAPGAYSLQATAEGYSKATHPVEVTAGEHKTQDFILIRSLSIVDSGYLNYSISQPLLVERVPLTKGTNAEIAEIGAALETSTAFAALGGALREGGQANRKHYSEYLLGENGPLADHKLREEAAKAVVRVLTFDPELEDACGKLKKALDANNRTDMRVLLPRFIRTLQGYVDSQGILLKGVGCRIVENQVIVPADVQPDTEGLGGIQVSVHLMELLITVVIASALQQQILGRAAKLDPLLGVTETLIENNEVIGGTGHGISIQGVAGRPEYLEDLSVRGNQIRGLAGTGFLCNENAFAVGLNIEGNRISDCGRAAGFGEVKGGMVVGSAAICHVNGNHVVQCGQGMLKSNVWGADLDTIYRLSFNDNQLLANGGTKEDCGGLRLQEVYGSTTVHDNVFSANRSIGLFWKNIDPRRAAPPLFPKELIAGINLYLKTTSRENQMDREERASVQNNMFKSEAYQPILEIHNLSQVNFSGNSAVAVGVTTGKFLGVISNTLRGIVANNLLEGQTEMTLCIDRMENGVIHGNNGHPFIKVQKRLKDNIVHELNIPVIVIEPV